LTGPDQALVIFFIVCYTLQAKTDYIDPPCSAGTGRATVHREEVKGLRKYEVVYIIRPDLDEEGTAAVVTRFSELVTNQGGEVLKIDQWGKRRLAFEVKDFREGFYVVMHMDAESPVATELDRVFKISDSVIRHIIVREEE
jgi:small subunit ribosomal protein S6